MNKAEEFLKSKGIHIGYAKGIRMIPVSGDAEYNLLELMEQYAQQVGKEKDELIETLKKDRITWENENE